METNDINDINNKIIYYNSIYFLFNLFYTIM
jgi:hypothetical protein